MRRRFGRRPRRKSRRRMSRRRGMVGRVRIGYRW